MNFQYFQTVTLNADIEIEDIGNCAIKAFTDLGNEYILIIDTLLGWSRIFQYGPVRPDFDILPAAVKESYNKIPFDERKIKNIIIKFLNMEGITQAIAVDREEALDDCKSIIKFMQQSNF